MAWNTTALMHLFDEYSKTLINCTISHTTLRKGGFCILVLCWSWSMLFIYNGPG